MKFTKDKLPKGQWWGTFRKKRLTSAMKINGPFEVETLEGTLSCPEGYLALDSKNNPYPIDKDEFESIYEEVDSYGYSHDS